MSATKRLPVLNRPLLIFVAVSAALLPLLIAIDSHARADRTSWDELLAEAVRAIPAETGFVVREVRRGREHDVVIRAQRVPSSAVAEVHVVQRGRWHGMRQTDSFSVAYEVDTCTASSEECDTVAAILHRTLGLVDRGLLTSPPAIPLHRPKPSGAGASGSVDPTTIPWPLELLRGLRPIALGAVLVALGILRQSAHGAGVAALIALATATASFAGVHPGPRTSPLWFVPCAAIVVLAAYSRHGHSDPRDRQRQLLVFTFSVAASGFGGIWGPIHPNGQGPVWIEAIAGDYAKLTAYGPGYIELFRVAGVAGANSDLALFALSILATAFGTVALYRLARSAGLGSDASLLAGFLVAAAPFSVAAGASESYFPAIAALCGWAGVLLSDAPLQRRPIPKVLGIAGAALLLTLAIRMHPVAWIPAALTPLCMFLPGGLRQHAALALSATLVIGGVVLVTSSDIVADAIENMLTGILMSPRPPLSFLPAAASLLLLLAVAAKSHRAALWLATGLTGFLWLTTRHGYDQSVLWQQGFDRLYLGIPIIAVASILEWFLSPNLLRALTASIVLVLFGLYSQVVRPTTETLEYTWLRATLPKLPSGCAVAYVASSGLRTMSIPSFVLPSDTAVFPIEPNRRATQLARLAAFPCVYYVHTSLCSGSDDLGECDAFEAVVPARREHQADFIAAPSHRGLPYSSTHVTTWIGPRVGTAKP